MFRRRVEGDTPEFTGCWRAFAAEFDYLYRTVLRHGVPPQEAEDTVQEVFLTMWRYWSEYDSARPLRPWLAGIAVRISRHRNQRRGRLPALPIETAVIIDPCLDPEESLSSRQERALVLSALTALPEKYRSPLVLREFDGLSVTEIARLDGISLATASARLHAARRAFGKVLRRLVQTGSCWHLGPSPDLQTLLAAERPTPAAPPATRRRAIAGAWSRAADSNPPVSARWGQRSIMTGATAALVAVTVLVITGRASQIAASANGRSMRPEAPADTKRSDNRPPARAPREGRVEPAPPMLPTGGLLAYFPFDEAPGSSVAHDLSGNQHHCLLHQLDPRSSWNDGVRGGALRVRGRGWLECSPRLHLPATAHEMTVAAWIRGPSTWGAQTIVRRQTGTGRHDDLFFGLTNGQLTVMSRTFRKRLDRSLPHPAGDWVHVAFRRAADGTLTLYAGGTPIGQNRGRVTPIGGVHNLLTIGGSINGADPRRADELFAGELDELVIYNRALAPEELEQLASIQGPEVGYDSIR
jgi:RNA polymerase sigma-70 factor, ECF subfamily